jgi:hypothetical protein
VFNLDTQQEFTSLLLPYTRFSKVTCALPICVPPSEDGCMCMIPYAGRRSAAWFCRHDNCFPVHFLIKTQMRLSKHDETCDY